MHTFEVWAPDASEVDLHLSGRRLAMPAAGAGWWRLAVEAAGPGDRYGFSLDRDPVRPDPRSAHQPGGVHALSQVVDHRAFAWHDRSWQGFHLPGSVLYELHIGTFSPEGTFDGAAARLPHLVDLGVDAVEVMPVAAFDGSRGWGYDGVSLYAPHPAYGGPDGLKRLVDACHRAGVAVILDVVYNHLGPSGNYLGEFGPYFSPAHRTNWGEGVNLDGPRSDEVRRFFIDNALMWLRDYHIDGLRLDAVHALADSSAVPFLEQLGAEVGAMAAHLRRPLTLIAESDLNDPRFVRPAREGGFGLDSAWADEWHHAWHAVFSGETDGYYADFGSLDHLAKALRQAWVYDGVWSEHRQRTHGRPPEGLAGDRFVVCTQNHDQVGNRAAGERSSALMSPGRLRVAAGLLLTGPFVPMLFQGEEWGAQTPWQYFTDFDDADLARAVTEGRRGEFAAFGWDPEAVPDPQDPGTFERSRLDWAELDREGPAGLLAWYRTLIGLRRQLPELTDGRLERVEVQVDHDHRALVVVRGPVLVLAHLGSAPVAARPGAAALLAGSEPGVAVDGDRVLLPPDSLAVIRRVPSGGRPGEERVSGRADEERRGRRTAAPPPTSGTPVEWASI